jgi:hypothetical protein
MGWRATHVIPGEWKHVNVLRALGRLSRQPTTIVDEPPVAPRARRAAAKARRGAPASIRRVSLRHPHLAGHELQAARDARSGHRPRGHFVRGHWKHQWHPSIDEHRLTWVDGDLRGDFTAGVVPGTKVLVAHAAPGETADSP